MNFKKSAIMLSFAAAMSLLNIAVFAIDMSKSEVIKTTGKVAVKKTNSPEFKKLNSNLKLSGSLKNLDGGDKVRTYNNSTADLVLKDTCQLTVTEQSIFEIPQILTKQDLKTLVAQQGSVLFNVQKGSNFQVQTADVICGVKGTTFSVSIFDCLDSIIETPGLQLGYVKNGGTVVDVYEGEVEVLDRKTNNKVSLKKNERYSTSDKIIDGINKGKQLFNKLGGTTSNEFNKALYEGNFWNNVGKQLKTKKYHADFGKYQILDSEKFFSNRMYGESYLGNGTFVACKATSNYGNLIAEPNNSGIVVLQGTGLIKIDTFDDKLNIKNELLANIYENGNEIITAVRNNNQNLCWREPGTLNIQKVPNGDVAYVYNVSTCKGYWANAASGSIPAELSNYKFSSIASMEREKKNLEKQNREKQLNTGERIGDKVIKDNKKKEVYNEVKDAIKNPKNIFKKGKKWF